LVFEINGHVVFKNYFICAIGPQLVPRYKSFIVHCFIKFEDSLSVVELN